MTTKFSLTLLLQIVAANSYTLMNSCIPTDYKGVIQRDEIMSMSFAMDYESGPRRTTYLVGGHSKQTIT